MSDSCLIPFDAKLAASCRLLVKGQPILFQFAPAITSEQNSSVWQETPIWALEPLRIHAGSTGRRITFQWQYIATDNIFNCKKIASITRSIKSYFYEFSLAECPVVKLKYLEIVPEEMNFRLHDLNITYSEEIVGNSGSFFPLNTKLVAQLSLASTGAILRGDKDKIQEEPLKKVKPEWY